MKQYEISSSELSIHKQITLPQLMCIAEYAKNYNGTIKLATENQEINVNDIPSLTAFFLTLGDNAQIEVLVKGENAQEAIEQIENICLTDNAELTPSMS
jgi:phosphotransferase system HPr-like phosphotransfer protein